MRSKRCSLYELAEWKNGLAFKKIDFSDSGKPIIKISELKNGITGQTQFTKGDYGQEVSLSKGDMVFSWSGNAETSIDVFWYDLPDGWLNQHIFKIIPAESVDKKYLYYLLKSFKPTFTAIASNKQTTGLGHVTIKDLKEIVVNLPEKNIQGMIGGYLYSIDKKIYLNKKINDNLQLQVMALFHQMFDESNSNRKNIRAEEYFDISIGKTPPRKEPQWFSKDSSDCVWVSISDMGSCGLYIGDSSEYLTHDAVERFNVKIVPDNTVILSFKLTVGRVAITDGCMTTNEAIAHFKTSQPKINEYLYCYLKNFNFQTMGSTSSIATAVNSKMVKGMPFIVPTDEELEKFHSIVSPLFTMIKSNQRESKHRAKLRDALLPKLMSGDIDVSDVKL